MSRTGLALCVVVTIMSLWFMTALYMSQPQTPEPVYWIEEPDAGSGILPAEDDTLPPRMFAAPCPIGPQNIPVVPPERIS